MTFCGSSLSFAALMMRSNTWYLLEYASRRFRPPFTRTFKTLPIFLPSAGLMEKKRESPLPHARYIRLQSLPVLDSLHHGGFASGGIFRYKFQVIPPRILQGIGVDERAIFFHINNLAI